MGGILVTTLGISWQVVPELFGFTNPDQLPLYRYADPDPGCSPAGSLEAIWIVTTSGGEAQRALLETWAERIEPPPELRFWWVDGLEDVDSLEGDRRFRELVLRVALLARKRARPGSLQLSLAGGRKTMSAAMHDAAYTIGCDTLLHVIDRFRTQEQRNRFQRLGPEELARALPPELAALVLPVVLQRDVAPGEVLATLADDADTAPWLAELPPDGGPVPLADTPLIARVAEMRRQADALATNLRVQLLEGASEEVFPLLYTLPPRLLRTLRATILGVRPEMRSAELAWLRALPKAELHCHLGGLFTLAETVEIAAAETSRVEAWSRRVPELAAFRERLGRLVRERDLQKLRCWFGDDLRTLRRMIPGVPQPLTVAAFLLAFRDHIPLLCRLVYGELEDPERMRGIGFARFERLGDLQGSGLLQSRATLRRALHVLKDKMKRDNVSYLELRCSPVNYTRGDLSSPRKVLDAILDILDEIACEELDIRLILCVSRHRDLRMARRTVRLVARMLEDSRFARRFVGCDLAGSEEVAEARAFRRLFRPLHERVVRLTIHAGEEQPAESIWQALYELNADRIGHGLSLAQHPELLKRFVERRIAVEMCPSSNRAIVGFDAPAAGGRIYPLKCYLKEGLKVTVNSDDPGICRTSLTEEYLRAAELSPGGLSFWEVLKLVYHGFTAAFCPHDERRDHIRRAQERLKGILLEAGEGAGGWSPLVRARN